jgi:hypothetical protein
MADDFAQQVSRSTSAEHETLAALIASLVRGPAICVMICVRDKLCMPLRAAHWPAKPVAPLIAQSLFPTFKGGIENLAVRVALGCSCSTRFRPEALARYNAASARAIMSSMV